jgi:predicted RNase H-like nuclease
VTAAVTLVRQEADQDLHIVIQVGPVQVGPAHMIVEAPNAPTCTPNATAYRKRQMIAARKAVLSAGAGCARAQITGVAFFDFLHGQTGVAPNGIELHPILGFACLSS